MGGEMHIGTRLAELAHQYADRTAIVDDAGAWSFRRFQERITRFGNAMHGIGLAAGDAYYAEDGDFAEGRAGNEDAVGVGV